MFKSQLKRFATPIAILAAVALVPLLTQTGSADEWNKKTEVTFSGPVEIPGKVLPAGTYVFKLADLSGNRNIVQIFDKNESQLYATILGVSDYRTNPKGDTVIRFEERPAGTPEAIREWFYPGDLFGVQFVYPHDEAVKIAQRTRQNVLSTNDSGTSADQMKNSEVTGVNPSGQQIDAAQVASPKKK